MSASSVTELELRARSTDIFGRVLCSARNHHFIVDGPVRNGCPGEALTPPELFLSSVAACGVELAQVIARELDAPLAGVTLRIAGTIDRANQPRTDVTLWSSVRLFFGLRGVSEAEGGALVAAFKRR